jgi:predicted nucleic acid-binding protein
MTDEDILQFVDTNILVYAHDSSAGDKNIIARKLMEGLWEGKTGCLSDQVLQEFYITITRKIRNPLESEIAAEIIAALSVWKVHTPDMKDVLRAIEIQRRCKISFWDAMIVCSAAYLSCDTLWSEDLNDRQVYEGVRVLNPFLR